MSDKKECDCRKPGYVSVGECVCEQPPAPPEVYYSFTVKGRYPNGNTAKMSGHVKGPDGCPFSVFDAAVAVCKDITPDLIVDMTKGGNVVVRKLKGKPR